MHSLIPRWKLRIAARAFTCFLKTLSQEISGSFLHLSIQGVAQWMTDLNSWNCTVIGEADCKDQFNRNLPADVLQHFDAATQWLRSQRGWRATQMSECFGLYINTTSAWTAVVKQVHSTLIYCHTVNSQSSSGFACRTIVFAKAPVLAGPVPLHCLWVGLSVPRQLIYIACGASMCINSDFMPWVNCVPLTPVILSGSIIEGASSHWRSFVIM